MLKVVLRVTEALPLLRSVGWVRVRVVAAEVLRRGRPVVHPGGAANEVLNVSPRQLGHLRHDLDARRAISDDGYALVGVVVVVVPACRVREVALEFPKSWNIGPGFVTACGSATGERGLLSVVYDLRVCLH